jgi:phosphatidylglycerol:prolipoprotein diacylglycerol transferase
MGYGLMRFVAEYFREPDAHLGLLALGLSMGQWLCVPMVVVGAWMWSAVVLQNGETSISTSTPHE